MSDDFMEDTKNLIRRKNLREKVGDEIKYGWVKSIKLERFCLMQMLHFYNKGDEVGLIQVDIVALHGFSFSGRYTRISTSYFHCYTQEQNIELDYLVRMRSVYRWNDTFAQIIFTFIFLTIITYAIT